MRRVMRLEMVLAVVLWLFPVAQADQLFEVEYSAQLGNGTGNISALLSPQELEDSILTLMNRFHIAGAQTCVIQRDSVVWTGAYGYMDAAATHPVTDTTLFVLASISKTVLATALMQCVENGLVDLDADISDYLPFAVLNPNFQSVPITCRMCLSHVSSIARNDGSWMPDMVCGTDWIGDMSQYLQDYLVLGGTTYNPGNYLAVEPGTYCEYSNYAFALLALVVENVTGITIEDYAQDSIFAPLDIYEASWFLADLNMDNIAMPLNYRLDYSTGGSPRSVFCVDLDGDGDQDLTVANRSSNSVSIRFNDGAGAFGDAVSYAAGTGPSGVCGCDFDGDGDNDLAVSNSSSDDVSILLNNGDGTFQSAVPYAAGDYPWGLFCGDFDGDSDNDVATANGASNDVSILLNNGDGTFQPAVSYALGNAPRAVFGCDLDGDADIDLAAANRYAGTISVLINNGDATFQSAVSYAAGNGPVSVFGGDLDGDSDNDLAVANQESDDVSILLNNGDGTFSSAVSYAAGEFPRSVFCCDLDGDSDVDIATADSVSHSISVLLNDGNGVFAKATEYFVGYGPYSVFCSDLDSDGDSELVSANSSSNSASIVFNSGNGTTPVYVAGCHTSHPLWPVGTLRTSASQLANHLSTLPTYGAGLGERVLDSVTVEEMMANHYPDVFPGSSYYGLGWISMMFTTGRVWYFEGYLPGVYTVMFVDPVQGNGVILLTNSEPSGGQSPIISAMWDYSVDVDGDGVTLAEDNCPLTANPGQEDYNSDGIGDACCCVIRGDVDHSAVRDISDLTYYVDFMFGGGPGAPCPEEGDIDYNGTHDISDLTFYVDFMFGGGDEPPPCP